MPADDDPGQTNVAWLETLVAEDGDTIDLRLLPGAFGYLVGFGLAIARREDIPYVMSACNLLLTVNAVTIWRPASWSYTDAERAARGKVPRKPGT